MIRNRWMIIGRDGVIGHKIYTIVNDFFITIRHALDHLFNGVV